MNILQLVPELNVGGVERGTVDLAKYLSDNGHKAVVISGGGRLVRELDMIGVCHYQLPVYSKNPIIMASLIKEVIRVIRRENIQIVHARSRVPAWIGFFAARMTHTPFITTAHGAYKSPYFSRVMGWGRTVIVASRAMADHMHNNFDVPLDKISLIPRGVQLDDFIFSPSKEQKGKAFTIGMASRITPLKGHSQFLKAVSIVARKIPTFKVLIAGDAPANKRHYIEELRLLVRRYGLTGIVEFLGHQENIPAFISQLDLFVSSTTTPEAFGRTIVEAMACGVPVVATKVGGVVDIVEDGVNGILVPPADPTSMADAIMRFHNDKEAAGSMVRSARKKVEEEYTLDKMAQRTEEVYRQTLKSFRILVIKLGAVGDAILSIPTLRAIRVRYPGAHIKVLAGLDVRQIFVNCPYINDTVIYDYKGRDKSPVGTWRIGSLLRSMNFDASVDLQNNRKSHTLAFLGNIPQRWGYDKGKTAFLLNRRIKDDAGSVDPVEHQFRLVRQFLKLPIEDKSLQLWPREEDREWVQKFLRDNWVTEGQLLIGINPMGSSKWISKRWPEGRIADLCDGLAKRFHARVLITGSHADEELSRRTIISVKAKPISAVGKTSIMQLAALIKRCDLFVASDSAPMHIAAAVGTPFVALFGSTDSRRHLPPNNGSVVLEKDMKCRPCYKRRCTILNRYACMKKITVDEVLDAAGALLKRRKPEARRVGEVL
ncbi:MAG: lipopolysaccharide heptosyltransferase II [Candidatus Omnitrophica bacterium]|nr:lipopolysaccharide heptosyltransferase II [Candidatus Omnitrophota bacterium]